MKGRIAKAAPTNREELKAILKAEWDKISQAEIDNFVNSMPNRLKACLKSQGGHTDY